MTHREADAGPGPDTSREFDVIARHFEPLATAASPLGLTDDAAVLDVPAGESLVATCDTLVDGIHFPEGTSADAVASKALRVNLSDLAAMGARPLGYLLAVSMTRETTDDWLAAFAGGLRDDQDRFGIPLVGGDTVSTPGPFTVSVTALGTVAPGTALTRSGARTGDAVFVSGTIGDGYLGLMAERGTLSGLTREELAFLKDRLRRPAPRLSLGIALRGVVNACVDVSDGLLADLAHICDRSGVSMRIDASDVPLSAAATHAIENTPDKFGAAVSGGDDYELAFTAPEGAADALARIADDLALPLTRIGRVEAYRDDRHVVTMVDDNGAVVAQPGEPGYQHAW